MVPDKTRVYRACFILQAIAALAFAIPLSASEPETVTFGVMFAPGDGQLPSASITAADIEASVGPNRYKVMEAQPWAQAAGRTVIVLDFAASSANNHACLIAEAWTAIKSIRETPPPLVIATGAARFLQYISFGKGGEFQVYGGGDLAAMKQI